MQIIEPSKITKEKGMFSYHENSDLDNLPTMFFFKKAFVGKRDLKPKKRESSCINRMHPMAHGNGFSNDRWVDSGNAFVMDFSSFRGPKRKSAERNSPDLHKKVMPKYSMKNNEDM